MFHSRTAFIGLVLASAFANLACADFIQIDTSLGTQTALLDESTDLAWLHLTLTNSQSFDSVEANLGPGGTFDGWRFATPQELSTFFTDYDSGVVNDTLALNLMNDLGGPLSDVYNPANGFHRLSSIGFLDMAGGLGHELFGYIAVDNFFGPSIDPNLQGSAVDRIGFPGTGSWLVQAEVVPEPGSLSLCLIAVAGIGLAASSRARWRRW